MSLCFWEVLCSLFILFAHLLLCILYPTPSLMLGNVCARLMDAWSSMAKMNAKTPTVLVIRMMMKDEKKAAVLAD